MTATARVPRTSLPMPTTTAAEEACRTGNGGQIEALDALYAAYMALNAAGGHFAWDNNSTSPMALVAKAAKAALARLTGVSARDARVIWDHMVENASGASWNYDLWRNGDI